MAALGEDFQRARESRSFAIADVARQLHIRAEFLEAIETERWDEIGDLVSLRGLLRTYARFLGLDGGAVVARFNQEYAPGVVELPGAGERPPLDIKALGAVVVGVVAIIVVFFSLTQFVERVRLHRGAAAVAVKAAATPHAAAKAKATIKPKPAASPIPSPRASSPAAPAAPAVTEPPAMMPAVPLPARTHPTP